MISVPYVGPLRQTPVVDPDDPQRPGGRLLCAPERAKDGVPAHRHNQPRGQSVRRPAADSMAEAARELGNAAGPPSGEAGGIRRPAAKGLPSAERVAAAPALDGDPDHDRPPLRRQILQVAAIASVPHSRGLFAGGAGAGGGGLTRNHPSTILFIDGKDADVGAGRPVGSVLHD
jgi:hypothetical protein